MLDNVCTAPVIPHADPRKFDSSCAPYLHRFDTVVTQELIIYLLRVYTRIRDSISTRGLFFSAFRKTRRGTLCRDIYIYIYPGAIRSGRARYPSIGVLVNQAFEDRIRIESNIGIWFLNFSNI